MIQLNKGTADSLDASLSKNLDKRVKKIAAKLMRVSGVDYLKGRDKRSIEFLGNLISDIFGNPGPADWKKVNANILALQGALKRIDENVGINHLDIDTDRHIIEKHNEEIKAISSVVNRNQNDLININAEMRGLRTFFEISTLADTIESLTDALLEIKIEGVKGFCSDRALDKDFLIENLQNMEANKAGFSPVFGSWEWRNYYKFEMCTLAMVDEAIWITIRIPLVKRSEWLTRIIPPIHIKRSLRRMEMYAVNVLTFRERDNDKYHVMTQSSFDLCNVLGNTRTCNTRDYRFGGASQAIPVEFMMDRFMIVSDRISNIKITEKCSGAVNEILVALDAVILTPANCSYSSSGFSIDMRESNADITKEIGLINIDKLEIRKIENFHENISRIFIEAIANKTSSRKFEKNREEIEDKLKSIDIKHESAWQSYNLEKWLVIAGVLTLAIVVLVMRVRSSFVEKRVRKSTFNEIAELRANLRKSYADRCESLSLHEVRITSQQSEVADDSEESNNKVSSVEPSTSTFRSPLHRSQFLGNK